ncbi:hypothetical protein BGZ61DRAFT_478225 [Ilyonectria robusta]|uniref:uncharacterized protein n=1 Tax=Ilyonectria robusta TaxID=1079257 RepID=UPI001E8DDC3F|nr:uncharacterized protein BGZ61DRAFT_478225 [Ilyonectria robusta]KAH8694639.1 hypothetical protein BGZ61DRAFT_478225 [Ilyonectria robusta]
MSSSRLPGPTNPPTSSSKDDWNSEDPTTDGSKSTEAGPSNTNVGPKEISFVYTSPTPSPDSWGYVGASPDADDANSLSKSKGKQPAKRTEPANTSAKPPKSGKRVRFDPIANPLDDLQQFKDKGVGIFLVVSRPSKGHFYQWSIALYNRVDESWRIIEAFQDPIQGAYEPVWITHSDDPRSLEGYVVMQLLAHVRGSSLNDLMYVALKIQERAERDTGLNSQGYVTEYGHWLRFHNYCTEQDMNAIWQLLHPYYGDQNKDIGHGN